MLRLFYDSGVSKVSCVMSGAWFNLLFVHNILNQILQGMSVSIVGRQTRIGAKRLFRMVKYDVSEALFDRCLSLEKRI